MHVLLSLMLGAGVLLVFLALTGRRAAGDEGESGANEAVAPSNRPLTPPPDAISSQPALLPACLPRSRRRHCWDGRR